MYSLSGVVVVRHMKYKSMSAKKAKMRMADFLAVGEACKAKFWTTPGHKKGECCSSDFLTAGTIPCVPNKGCILVFASSPAKPKCATCAQLILSVTLKDLFLFQWEGKENPLHSWLGHIPASLLCLQSRAPLSHSMGWCISWPLWNDWIILEWPGRTAYSVEYPDL